MEKPHAHLFSCAREHAAREVKPDPFGQELNPHIRALLLESAALYQVQSRFLPQLCKKLSVFVRAKCPETRLRLLEDMQSIVTVELDETLSEIDETSEVDEP